MTDHKYAEISMSLQILIDKYSSKLTGSLPRFVIITKYNTKRPNLKSAIQFHDTEIALQKQQWQQQQY